MLPIAAQWRNFSAEFELVIKDISKLPVGSKVTTHLDFTVRPHTMRRTVRFSSLEDFIRFLKKLNGSVKIDCLGPSAPVLRGVDCIGTIEVLED